jgi:hypothetical protein
MGLVESEDFYLWPNYNARIQDIFTHLYTVFEVHTKENLFSGKLIWIRSAGFIFIGILVIVIPVEWAITKAHVEVIHPRAFPPFYPLVFTYLQHNFRWFDLELTAIIKNCDRFMSCCLGHSNLLVERIIPPATIFEIPGRSEDGREGECPG